MLPLATIPWPDPLPMPAPFGLAWFLLLLTFFLHLVPMNLAFGGAVIGALLRARRTTPPPPRSPTGSPAGCRRPSRPR